MSDSEEDYMSDAFLAKCQDTRPGLVSGKVAKQYKQEVRIKELNVKNQIKPLKVLEAEKRTEGLGQALGEDNKGFSLLQKMGYKPGMAMGKKGTGRAEPVPIKIRTGRGGLGEDTERKRKQDEMTAMRISMMQKRKKREATFQKDYRAEMSRQMQERQQQADLYKSQRVCEQLDEEQGVEDPDELYYWTPVKMSLLLRQAEKELQEDEETTCALSDTKRSDNEYLLGPSESVGSASRLEAEDSGAERLCGSVDVKTTRRDQPTYSDEIGDDTDEDRLHGSPGDPSDTEDDILPPLSEQLTSLTDYLRTKYLYCVWCGTRFDDADDLTQNCPGDTSDAHDS